MTIRFDRLLKLADLLESLPPGRFDYGSWADSDDEETVLNLTAPACNTTACALGWATAIPEFGLCLARGKYDGIGVATLEDAAGAHRCYSHDLSERASAVAFGLSTDDHEHLFIPSDEFPEDDTGCADWDAQWGTDDRPLPKASAKTVAEHIRRFVRDRQ